MKAALFLLFIAFFNFFSAQISGKDTFEKIKSEAAKYVVDTTAVPEDRLTQEIRKLRAAKGGFNINEVLLFKIGEDKAKGEITAAAAEKAEKYITTGDGKRSLDNAVIWIYRKHFTLSEIKKITRFYQSSAGQKMAENFPVIILESTVAAEKIMGKLKKEK